MTGLCSGLRGTQSPPICSAPSPEVGVWLHNSIGFTRGLGKDLETPCFQTAIVRRCTHQSEAPSPLSPSFLASFYKLKERSFTVLVKPGWVMHIPACSILATILRCSLKGCCCCGTTQIENQHFQCSRAVLSWEAFLSGDNSTHHTEIYVSIPGGFTDTGVKMGPC